MIPKKILLCTDFSENGKPATQLAIEYAKAFGAELAVVHVIGSWPDRGRKGKDAADKEDGQKTPTPVDVDLDQVAEECKKELNVVKTYTKIGAPAREIVDLAEEESVGLIVAGTHGRTGLTNVLLGSVADTIVKHAPCPVLTVRSFSK